MAFVSPLRAQSVQRKNSMDEDSRFSHPAKPEKRKRPHAGYTAWPKRFTSLKSPSSASTASLAQLHDKLANLPYYEFTKEPVSVCAQPELSIVNEVNESQTSNSLDSNSTLKLRSFGVSNFRAHVEDRKSQSDGEIIKSNGKEKNDIINKNVKGSQSDKYVKKSAKVDEREVSSLVAATIGSADISVINETIERLPKDKDINKDNLINLLIQEALQSRGTEKDRLSDSGINVEDGKKSQEQNNQDSETIEDTQYTGPATRTRIPAGLKNITAVKTLENKVLSKSTSDESNTETPISFVTLRKRNRREKSVKIVESEHSDDNVTFDDKAVEDFFSQHYAQNQIGDAIISPTLAKKINATSSESSEEILINDLNENFHFKNVPNMECLNDIVDVLSPTPAKKINQTSSETGKGCFQKDRDINVDIRNIVVSDLDIVECLNDIVDKVCSDFEKCTEFFNNPGTANTIPNMAKQLKTDKSKETITPHEEKDTSVDHSKDKNNQKPAKNTKSKGKQTIKLKFTSKKQKAEPKAKGKLILEPISKMSTIPEANESEVNKTIGSETKKAVENVYETPLARRKRKLYSPKDDQLEFDKSINEQCSSKPNIDRSGDEDEIALAEPRKEKLVTPKFKEKPVASKSATSCYKEIEKERRNYRRIQNRRSKNFVSPPSPKTKRLDDVFEHLKDNLEVHENEKIILVDKRSNKDLAFYNYSSDSEDEDFKQKKIELQKGTSTSTIGSGNSLISIRQKRSRSYKKYTEDVIESTKPVKRKKIPRRKTSKTNSLKPRDVKVDSTDLVDEKVRDAPSEDLNSSFVITKAIDQIKDLEPMIKPPEIEFISDENAKLDVDGGKEQFIEKVTEKLSDKKNKVNKNSTKQRKVKEKIHEIKKTINPIKATPKEDIVKSKDSIKDDDRTISPLPGLVIETEVVRNQVEDSFTNNLASKMQKMYKDGTDAYNDTITTQNMLSDDEKANSSPQMNITHELGRIFGKDSHNNSKEDEEPRKDFVEDKNIESDANTVDVTINSEQMSKLSKAESSKSKKRSRFRLKGKDKTICSEKCISVKENPKIKHSKNNRIENLNLLNSSQKSKTSVKSHIEQINDEIICFDNKIITRSKTSEYSSRNEDIEIISIGTESEEKSIATNGITGHGDMNESPPSPKLLRENLSPREIHDMDPVIREYYIELSNKANISKSSSENQIDIKDRTMRKMVEEDNKSDKNEKGKRHKFLEHYVYDFNKLLPSQRETETESSSRSSAKKTLTVSLTRLSSEELEKWLPKKTLIKMPQTQKTIKLSPIVTRNRKSQISPIKLDLDFMTRRKNYNKATSSKDEPFNTQDTEISSKLDSIPKKYFIQPTHESSPILSGDSVQSTPRTAPKRKCPDAKPSNIKKRKLQDFNIETVDIASSLQSSNVKDWLRNSSTISRVDYVDVYSDMLQNLMEKLDTTLAEIHQTTTKDFISLFAELQKKLLEMKEEHRNSNRETAYDILTVVAKMLDKTFAERNQRAEESESETMSWLQRRAGEVLRRDCVRKRALLALLRDDARAAREHLNNTTV